MPNYSCEHLRCTRYNTETVGDRDSESDAGDCQSECSDMANSHRPSSTPIYSDPMSSFSILDTLPSTITSTGVQNLISLPEGTPTYSIPLAATNLASFDAPPTGQGYTPYNSLSTSTRGKAECVWYCSNCNDGPHSYRYVFSCTECFHKRCDHCPVKAEK
jgi:hypothetical protein